MTSETGMQVIHWSRREGEMKISLREVRTGHSVKWKTPDTQGMMGKQTFSSLSCLLGYSSTCHFIASFEMRSLGPDVEGPLPWVSTVGLELSVIFLSWLDPDSF